MKIVKRNLIAVLITVLAVAACQAQTIKIKGSTDLVPVEEHWSTVYGKLKPSVKIMALGGGDSIGLNSLRDGSADCASVSRSVTDAELKKLNSPVETAVGYDAILFVVHPQNPVRFLTYQQLHDIYSGKVKNWSEVGGLNVPIHALAPDTNHGTGHIVREKVMGGQPFGPMVRTADSEHDLLATVWTDPGAISFSGIALAKEFPHVTVAKDKSAAAYAPTVENLKNGRYPLIHPVHLYCSASASSAIKEFLSWTSTTAGQQSVEMVGLIPLKYGKR